MFSEDPFLTGRMGVAYVQGLQGDDPHYLKVAATVKHFAVDNVETNRERLSAEVDERSLMEYWLPHWKAAIMEGHAQSVMASYNAINGAPDAINKYLLTDILRGQWGFDGFVTDDLGGVNLLVAAHHHRRSGRGNGTFHTSWLRLRRHAVRDQCSFSDEERPFAYRRCRPRAGTGAPCWLPRLGAFDPPEPDPYSKISATVIRSRNICDFHCRLHLSR